MAAIRTFPDLFHAAYRQGRATEENIAAWFGAGVCAVGMGGKLMRRPLCRTKAKKTHSGYPTDHHRSARPTKIKRYMNKGKQPANTAGRSGALLFFATTVNYLRPAGVEPVANRPLLKNS